MLIYSIVLVVDYREDINILITISDLSKFLEYIQLINYIKPLQYIYIYKVESNT